MKITINNKRVNIEKHPIYDFYAASETGDIYFRPAISRKGVPRGLTPFPREKFWEKANTFPVYAKNTPAYLKVRVTSGKISKMPSVHRFMMECFFGIKSKKVIVRHLNGDHLNNNLYNLAYGTTQENVNDTMVHTGNYALGVNNGRAKLTETDVLSIRECYANGFGIKEIHKKYKHVSEMAIRYAVKRKTWAHL